jgi:hypothetical protein
MTQKKVKMKTQTADENIMQFPQVPRLTRVDAFQVICNSLRHSQFHEFGAVAHPLLLA